MRRLRRGVWLIGAPIRATLVLGIRGYRATLSGWLGGQCRFYPSCSRYAEEAISSRGALAGAALTVWRVLRCNPFGRGGLDPPPRSAGYDDIIPSLRDTETGHT